ncbi:arf-GAP domain and FG repeat-containing protein 1 isoform X1 [Cotesia glomerata]|uniref:Arf-GAP domain-containing protein n=1 Tax=Cotesia glomerata TaxID=32391 RepID=A0AAV7J1L6_COTGL|nr:arf-GAP domain and FG repeat-containing protein 1 isoform X1 [Cotesia glomerata]KAH0563846.1 hypothetical protein KQX54_007322 [Cotesia glomerata]
MASAKRKQDEKHLKILRELVSQPGNKECFDCRQRGPTYVNMTIGSFVCTSCSGLLRGLTPPHRVKSISMATFTAEEIEFINQRGNEYCKKIWLGLVNSNTPITIDTKDEQKMKDLMSAKYEHKRYYLDPSMASDNCNNQKAQSAFSNRTLRSIQTNVPRVPHVGVLPTLSTPNQKKKTTSEPTPTFTADFVADFSQVPDPFVNSTPASQFPGPIQPQASFANFDNNPAFESPKNLSNAFNSTGKFLSNFNGVNSPPPEDRYAALKDLDSMMKKTQLREDTQVPNVAPTWIASNTNTANSFWTNMDQTNHFISNPFTGNDLWKPSIHAINNNNNNNINNNNTQSLDNTYYNSANPFNSTLCSTTNGFNTPNSTDVLASSQMMTSLSEKAWHPTVPLYQANPFMVGTGVGNSTRSSNNPFL